MRMGRVERRPGAGWRWAAVALVLAAGAGCKRGGEGAGGAAAPGAATGAGRALDPAGAADLRLSPDGKHVTYLASTERPRLKGLPPQMVVGELYAAPVEGGSPRKLGSGVTNVPGGALFSPDGRWVLLLEGYDASAQAGRLRAVDLSRPDAAAVALGERVTYMLASPDSRTVAFVDGGTLKVGVLPEGPFREVAGEVANAEFFPDGKRLLFKRRLSAAGGLAAVPADGSRPPQKLADQVADYRVSPDGRHVVFAVRNPASPDVADLFHASLPALEPTLLAQGTSVFGFSPDGRFLARTEGQRPGVPGDLVVGPAAGGPGRKVGERVEAFTFAPDSSAVACLERTHEAGKGGWLSVAALPDGAPRRLGSHVLNYEWSGDGRYVGFHQLFLKPLPSTDLMLHRVGEEGAPVKVGQGVLGFGFAPDRAALFFRANCVREGRACDLLRADVTRPTEPARKVASGIYSFKVSEDGQRVLTTVARLDAPTFDVAVQNLATGAARTLDQAALLPAYFAAQDGSRVVYLLQGRARRGVHVATGVP